MRKTEAKKFKFIKNPLKFWYKKIPTWLTQIKYYFWTRQTHCSQQHEKKNRWNAKPIKFVLKAGKSNLHIKEPFNPSQLHICCYTYHEWHRLRHDCEWCTCCVSGKYPQNKAIAQDMSRNTKKSPEVEEKHSYQPSFSPLNSSCTHTVYTHTVDESEVLCCCCRIYLNWKSENKMRKSLINKIENHA